MDYRVEYDNPPREASVHSGIQSAAMEFGRALNRHGTVRLISEGLIESVVTQRIGPPITDRAGEACVVCGASHGPDDFHGPETTANRLLMQHEYGNHSQCHPAAGCTSHREESR